MSIMRADDRRRGLDSLLIRARVVVEHVEERLDVQLREDARGAEQRVRHLRVVRWCLDGVPRHVVLRPITKKWVSEEYWVIGRPCHVLLGVLRLRHARIASLQQFMDLVEVRHPVWRYATEVSLASLPRHSGSQSESDKARHAPFCFTLSKDITKSANEPGNAFARGCCSGTGSCDAAAAADGGRAPTALCATFAGSLLSKTPGGNCGCCCWAGGGIGDAPAEAPGAAENACACCGNGEGVGGDCTVAADATETPLVCDADDADSSCAGC